MKKVVLIATSLLLIACGEKSTDDLIKDKNITELKNRKATIQAELEKIEKYVGAEAYANGKFSQAITLFDKLIKDKEFIEFLTLPAYELLD